MPFTTAVPTDISPPKPAPQRIRVSITAEKLGNTAVPIEPAIVSIRAS